VTLDIITYLGSISSISGINLLKIINAKDKPNKIRELYDSTRTILTRIEESTDTLVGYWSLKEWDFEVENLPDYTVSGGLAIHHKDRKGKAWKGTMCLDYRDIPNPEPIQMKGQPYPFIAAYDVAFYQDKNGIFQGECHMVEKVELKKILWKNLFINPKLQYKWRGEFIDCQIQGVGSARSLVGKYQNIPKKSYLAGKATFSFHMPITWGEVDFSKFQ